MATDFPRDILMWQIPGAGSTVPSAPDEGSTEVSFSGAPKIEGTELFTDRTTSGVLFIFDTGIIQSEITPSSWGLFMPEKFAPSEPLTPAERDFEEQKRAFLALPQKQLSQYSGQYVACRNGKIVDHDPDEDALVKRFFPRFGDVPVYITKIGEDSEVVIATPFFG